uniref:Immunoglobulin domain-containing protein n=1 Tax=Astyanax mexicanus TaxID=7994 RepID=A0A3B1K720_ASTMX
MTRSGNYAPNSELLKENGKKKQNQTDLKNYQLLLASFSASLTAAKAEFYHKKISSLTNSRKLFATFKTLLNPPPPPQATCLTAEALASFWESGNLILPCSLQPNIIHLHEEYKDRNRDQMESYRGRTALFKEELKKGNASLKLSALQPSDDGAYKCLIEYGLQYDDITLYVEVKGERQIHIFICMHPETSQRTITPEGHNKSENSPTHQI